MEELSKRQRQILDYIRLEVQTKGYPPSVREIGEAVGLSSSSSVHSQLAQLENLGYIRRDPTKPRTIELLADDDSTENSLNLPGSPGQDLLNVPVVGTVTAGVPILATENVDDYFPLPRSFTRTDSAFMLKVRGDSMVNAGIFDGDMVIVSNENKTAYNGEIVVAMIDEEATVKRFFKEVGRVRLQPENDAYEPIYSDNVQILGKVIGLIRRIH